MTQFDQALSDLKAKRDANSKKYAKTLAEIEAKKETYQQSMAALAEHGCKTLEEAQTKIEQLQTKIEKELTEIATLLK